MSTEPSARPRQGPVVLRPAEPPAGPGASLPRPLTSFVGRDRDVAAVRCLLGGDARLVTLTGPGGVGKTRLAIQAAAAVRAAFPDGVWFVPLAPLQNPALVAATIAHALGLREGPGCCAADVIAVFLRDRRSLLVLDNVEQLLPAAPLVADLLTACSATTALVTSRAPLRVSGEQVYPVSPLALPASARPAAVADLAAVESVRLFVTRARAAAPSFSLTEDNAHAVAAICHRLDGLPLAIELAAARAAVLPPAALLVRLQHRFQILVGGPRDQPARLRTLRAAIGWSHDLLGPAEQALLRRLAVFVGGFSLEAAEAIASAAGDPQRDVLNGVTALVDASLLQAREQPGGEFRFDMLESVREYALERLADSGEQDAVQDRHLVWCLALAEATDTELQSVTPGAWLRRLEDEHDNIRAALAWAADRGETETGLRLAGALFWFWMFRHAGEGRSWLERYLAEGGIVAPAVRARALVALAVLTRSFEGDEVRAAALLEEALALRRQLGDTPGTARALAHLAMATVWGEDLDRAAMLAGEGLELARAVDDALAAGGCLGALALVARGRGDAAMAQTLLEEAAASLRRSGFRWGIAWALGHLAELARARGDLAEALARLGESVALYDEAGDAWGAARALAAAAAVATAAGQFAVAARFFGAAEAWREAIGALPNPVDLPAYECAAAAARGGLGQASFAAAWATGRALSMNQAVAEAASVAAALAPARALPGGLSAREVEVLRLVAMGLSNPQIAERLSLSRRTVQAHLRTVYRKLGVATRREAAGFARDHGLA
jgi:predicted ATPase/DNA-binding CsgD family transcriptional regulator